jgi:hypothetical protein
MLSVESAVAPDAATRGALLRERARYLEEELLDDKSALATLDSILSGGDDAEAAEMRERLNSKKAAGRTSPAPSRRTRRRDRPTPRWSPRTW